MPPLTFWCLLPRSPATVENSPGSDTGPTSLEPRAFDSLTFLGYSVFEALRSELSESKALAAPLECNRPACERLKQGGESISRNFSVGHLTSSHRNSAGQLGLWL